MGSDSNLPISSSRMKITVPHRQRGDIVVLKWLIKGKAESEQPTDPAVTTEFIPQEKIAARAYEIWNRKGRPEGTDVQNWIEAEAELREEYAARARHGEPIRHNR
jgi:hypothetical protein